VTLIALLVMLLIIEEFLFDKSPDIYV